MGLTYLADDCANGHRAEAAAVLAEVPEITEQPEVVLRNLNCFRVSRMLLLGILRIEIRLGYAYPIDEKLRVPELNLFARKADQAIGDDRLSEFLQADG
jgi:hypothetical protein